MLNLTFIIPVLASILILGLVGTLDNAYAEVCHTIADGSWDSAIWENALNNPCTPLPSDDKSINHVVTMSTSVSNSGVIGNFGTLTVSSTLTNTGDIFNQNIITFTSTAVVNNNGMFENFGGTVTLDPGAIIENNHFLTNNLEGTLINDGTINNIAGGILNNNNDLTNDGTVTNSGTINNNSGATINNNSGATLRNNSGSTITNDFGATITNDFGATITNIGTTINNGVILECGIYTGNLPTPNGLVTCIITEDTTISQDLTYPCGFTLTVNSGFVYTIDGDSTVTVCGPVTVKDGGGVLIKFGSTLWVLVN